MADGLMLLQIDSCFLTILNVVVLSEFLPMSEVSVFYKYTIFCDVDFVFFVNMYLTFFIRT